MVGSAVPKAGVRNLDFNAIGGSHGMFESRGGTESHRPSQPQSGRSGLGEGRVLGWGSRRVKIQSRVGRSVAVPWRMSPQVGRLGKGVPGLGTRVKKGPEARGSPVHLGNHLNVLEEAAGWAQGHILPGPEC